MEHYAPVVRIVKKPLQGLRILRKAGQAGASDLFVGNQIVVIADPQSSLRIRHAFSEQGPGKPRHAFLVIPLSELVLPRIVQKHIAYVKNDIADHDATLTTLV